jgi:hypothetical protein
VAVITDACHPCIRNPIRPSSMPVGEPRMLLAARALAAGDVLGLYFGRLLTCAEDTAATTADLKCAAGLQHAYNMAVCWSRVRCRRCSARAPWRAARRCGACRQRAAAPSLPAHACHAALHTHHAGAGRRGAADGG